MNIVPLEVTTNASGAGTATAARSVDVDTARLVRAVEWVDGTMANGGTAILSVVNTLSGVDRTILTLGSAQTANDAWYQPRVQVHSGTAGTLAFYDLPIVNGDLRLTVSAGGSVATCAAYVYLE